MIIIVIIKLVLTNWPAIVLYCIFTVVLYCFILILYTNMHIKSLIKILLIENVLKTDYKTIAHINIKQQGDKTIFTNFIKSACYERHFL